jgi:hypothetical protein
MEWEKLHSQILEKLWQQVSQTIALTHRYISSNSIFS